MNKYKKVDYNKEDLSKESISDLKKIADYWLRKFLLENTERVNGKYYCPIKRQWYSEKNMHVAHYIDRGYSMWTRYSLINCHLISEQSNSWDSKILVEGYKSKHHKDYEEYLVNIYGEKIIEKLFDISNNKSTFARQDYLDTIEKFKSNE